MAQTLYINKNYPMSSSYDSNYRVERGYETMYRGFNDPTLDCVVPKCCDNSDEFCDPFSFSRNEEARTPVFGARNGVNCENREKEKSGEEIQCKEQDGSGRLELLAKVRHQHRSNRRLLKKLQSVLKFLKHSQDQANLQITYKMADTKSKSFSSYFLKC